MCQSNAQNIKGVVNSPTTDELDLDVRSPFGCLCIPTSKEETRIFIDRLFKLCFGETFSLEKRLCI